MGKIEYRTGVDYYPEHWDKERWALDAKLMREAGLQVVRLAEFAWSRLEPAENGGFEFEWLDEAIEKLSAEGLKVIIGTPTATPPAWMVTAHPEMLPVAQDGRTFGFGGRRHYCASSEYYRQQAARIVQAEAEHYKNNPAVIGWQIDNELGNHTTMRCHCPRCRSKFQGWLKNRYGSLAQLNQAWGTVFWSQEYSDWAQIPVPVLAPAGHNPALELDFRRFSSDNAVEFSELQIKILRDYFPPERAFITHNVIPLDDFLNLYDLTRSLDFVSWDNYPHGGFDHWHVTFHHDLLWGFKQKPAWVMEQQISAINWTKFNPPVPPGQARLWSVFNRAKGAGGTVYFRWRECRFGQEQYHSAFLRHNAKPSRGYTELQATHAELGQLPADYGDRPSAGVALLFSYDDAWAFEIEPNNPGFDYHQLARDFHKSLVSRNIPCDILPRGTKLETLQKYQLVIALAPQLVDPTENQTWQRYVEQGGKLLLTLRAGTKEQSNIWTEQDMPGGLSEFAGVEVEEWLSYPPPGTSQEARWGWREITAQPIRLKTAQGQIVEARRLWVDKLASPAETQTLATYQQTDADDFFAGSPALTVRQRGAGEVYYLGSWPEASFFEYLWREVFETAVECADTALPVVEGLEVVFSGELRQYVTFFNHNNQPIEYKLPAGYSRLNPAQSSGKIEPREIWFCRRDF